jgi:hypothetical protein
MGLFGTAEELKKPYIPKVIKYFELKFAGVILTLFAVLKAIQFYFGIPFFK